MTVDSEEDGQGDSSESSSEEKPAKRRKCGDDEKKVPFVTHATPPEIVKEFMFELKSKWAIFGTSEVGVAARGALALKAPVVMFANNVKHEEILREGMEAGIVETCLAGGDFSSKSIADEWAAANASSDSDSSESDSGDQTSNQSADNTKGSKKEKKSSKKEKDNKEKKNSNKKTKKKDKKGKKAKKDKKDKTGKKDKKDNKKDNKKKTHAETIAALPDEDVLKGLIAKGSGTQG